MLNDVRNLGKPSEKNVDRQPQSQSCYDYVRKVLKKDLKNLEIRNKCVVIVERIASGFGSTKKHHDYKGGLIVHVSEVMENALLMAKSSTLEIDLDLLILAIIYHDYAKIYDYVENNGKIEYTNHYYEVRHLCRSYAEFMKDFQDSSLTSEQIDKVGNIILSHHGNKEWNWGSAADPMHPESYIIHYADMLSAKCAKDYYVRELV